MVTREPKILVIEDSSDRIDWFVSVLTKIPCRFYIATTAQDAVAGFRAHKFDCVFFDHDLGHDVEDSSWILNQMLFAGEHDHFHLPMHAIVHSSNSVGVENIVSKLDQLGVENQRVPFENLKGSINIQDFLSSL
jgi:hypothetical protein